MCTWDGSPPDNSPPGVCTWNGSPPDDSPPGMCMWDGSPRDDSPPGVCMWDGSPPDDSPPGMCMSSPDDSLIKLGILMAWWLNGKTPHVLNPASTFAGTIARNHACEKKELKLNLVITLPWLFWMMS